MAFITGTFRITTFRTTTLSNGIQLNGNQLIDIQHGSNHNSKAFSPIKLFMAVIYKLSLKARVLIPDKPLQPSVMFVGKARGPP
jgi:hypothetical protein